MKEIKKIEGFTPGPWEPHISSKGIFQVAQIVPSRNYPEDSGVCLVKQICPISDFENITEERKSNAELIAYAPELYSIAASLAQRVKILEDGLRQAVGVIKQYYNCDEVWDIYLDNAPEMKGIKQLLNQ